MSIQWSLIAGVLYSEMAIAILIALPIIPARKWNKLFKSRFLQVIAYRANIYFFVALGFLLIMFLDSIREMKKYSSKDEGAIYNPIESELQTSMKLFRAQRNFHITGFALFLLPIIYRLISLLSKQAVMEAENEAALKQAKSATSAAKTIMSQQAGAGEAAQTASNEAHQKEVTKLSKTINDLKDSLKKAELDKEVLQSQAKALETEYDRLTEEHRKLEHKLKVQGGDKKSE